MTNPEVFEIVAQRIDSIFKANPDKNIISVSQNDGNDTNCTCDACHAIDEHEDALLGSLITFLNKLAARFPDKQFSTMAYPNIDSVFPQFIVAQMPAGVAGLLIAAIFAAKDRDAKQKNRSRLYLAKPTTQHLAAYYGCR